MRELDDICVVCNTATLASGLAAPPTMISICSNVKDKGFDGMYYPSPCAILLFWADKLRWGEYMQYQSKSALRTSVW